MKNARSLLCSIPVFALVLTTLLGAASAATTPAIEAFEQAFAKVNDYTMTVTAHEVKGTSTQDRVYHYAFERPTSAKVDIVSGDGTGTGGVWKGGDVVKGHKKILFATIVRTVPLHDYQATSLRGYTIPDGLMQNEVARYKEVKGDLTQKAGPDIDGVQTDEIDLLVAEPSQNDGVTKMSIFLSQSTHFPVRQIRYAGDKVVAQADFSDIKTNVGLTDANFPF
jgi:outer membrane lipoprotein-sorting protein